MDSVIASPVRGETSHSDLITQLIFSRLPQCGPATYWALVQGVKNLSGILDKSFDLNSLKLREATLNALRELQQQRSRHPLFQQAQRDIDWLHNNSINAISINDEYYPELLKSIAQPPPLLFIKGEINNLLLPQVAIVGSRNPSPTGRENALRFAQCLSSMGFVITSGMALGIDAASHQGAIENNAATIAVMGTGIDKVYPKSHQCLADEIIATGGTLVSEFPIGTTPQANHFPRRNRIISGLSLGVLVIEAAIKSGSLITARYALEQNREVFSIPGSIHNPLSRGCHALLREGAVLVEGIDDLREHLQSLLQLKRQELDSLVAQTEDQPPSNVEQEHLSGEEKTVLKQLDFDITPLDILQQRTGLPPGNLLSILMSLELKGLIEQSGGGYQRLPETTF